MGMVCKKITLAVGYAAASATAVMGTVDMLAAADNVGVAYIRGDDGVTDVPIPKGVSFPLHGVDLSTVFLRGTPGDVVVLIGGTFFS